ncbi:MAG TPA: cobalamin biosynthesis protein CobD [Treponema sp.]|nr:cobalamin biosynthesis protein CobD [Treponema sp.]
MLEKYHIVFAILAGFVLDFFIGDPHCMPHPVRFIGALISLLEKGLLNSSDTKTRQRGMGFVLVFLVLFVTGGITFALVHFSYKMHFAAGFAIEVLLCYWCIAANDLKKESINVLKKMQASSIEESRKALSRIVGRDTQNLTEEEIVKATVETVAENSNDGVIAPLFYMALGGPVLGMVYKAINTMDSMVGYKNDRYRFFGTAAARCDDLFGFIPARLSAIFAIASCPLLRLKAGNAFRIFRRDRYKHQSPNSAQTESVYAGAMEIRLGGDALYGGILEHKEFLGDEIRKPCAKDIRRSCRLMYASSLLATLVFCAVRLFLTR